MQARRHHSAAEWRGQKEAELTSSKQRREGNPKTLGAGERSKQHR